MESFKDKITRYSFIIIAIGLVIAGFSLQKGSNNNSVEKTAIVIHESNDINDKPLVAILSYDHKKYMLKLFQVDRLDSNKFHLINEISQAEKPLEMRKDKETNGLWLHFNKKWVYFNEYLEEETRDKKYRLDHRNNRINWEKENNLITLTSLTDDSIYSFPINENDKVHFIAPLAKDNSLWLAIINNEVKVLLL
ncbi:hypothetical protein [Bacillus kwashiorkori]|uniref:hypothetical protein n=1 Tax=Bacillus kwashiorkori TaxID=1522318 RepID=UPI0007837F50|nr:hypothetical protein [Bacillus kwashiorkori]